MADGPARLLFVHHRPELGGAPTSLFYLLEKLDRDRFEPHVYCPPGPAAELFRTAPATVHTGPVAGFTHIWASTYSGRRWLLFGRELAHLPRHLRAFRRTLRSQRFALVHLNDSPLLPAAWLAHRAGIPVVWHLRSALPHGSRDRRSRMIRSLIQRLATASIAINDNVAESFSVDAEVVPNPVDLTRFAPGDAASARVPLGLPADLPVISYFGFIYPSKGFREFIQAADLLRSCGIEACYLIVGGDVRGDPFFDTRFGRALQMFGLARNHEREAKLLVTQLGLDDAVRFVPFTADTPLLYRASDVVVVPSRGPELGRPVIEAAACGRVIVASGSLDGAGLLIPGETGFLIPRRSPDVLAAALEKLIGDPELRGRLGENARRHAEALFSAERNTERVMELYDRLLAGR